MTNLMNCHGIWFSPYSVSSYPILSGAGVYLLCNRNASNRVDILYIGEANDFSGRLTPNHHCWDEAIKLGMNEIHLHFESNHGNRIRTETYLRNRITTPLNRQGRNGVLEGIIAALGPTPLQQNNDLSSILAALLNKKH